MGVVGEGRVTVTEHITTEEAERIAEIERLVERIEELERVATADLPRNLRDRLHVLACSTADFTFWIERRAQPDDLSLEPKDQMWYAQEVETGIGAWGVTPREAVDAYFRSEFMGLG